MSDEGEECFILGSIKISFQKIIILEKITNLNLTSRATLVIFTS
jgi:hypothetical protein